MLVLGNQHCVVGNQQYARLDIQTLKKPVGVLVAMIKKKQQNERAGKGEERRNDNCNFLH